MLVEEEELYSQFHKDIIERIKALDQLTYSFRTMSNKERAWNTLITLTTDENTIVKYSAAKALGYVFPYTSNKLQAWNDLHNLTTDPDKNVRSGAARALGYVFSQVSKRTDAWNDLHLLANDPIGDVKRNAAISIGSVFSQIPDPIQAWDDLSNLATVENIYVKIDANCSLGKASIFKACQAEKEDDYEKELENAINFFEKAVKESPNEWFNPAQFCFSFYRSFYTIIFKKYESIGEMDTFLEDMEDAIEGSESKELLFEFVENLLNALKEVQSLNNLDLEAKKGELNFYRKYCDRAAELMRETEETAPFATLAMKKGLPILERNLKGIIEEIQQKAKTACKEAKGTPAEYAACAVNDFAKRLKIGSPEYLVVQIENLVFLLKSYIPKIEENNVILDRIDKILREEDVVIQYTLLNNLIPQIIDIQVSEKTAPILSEIKCLRVSVDSLVESIDELQNPQEYLNIIRQNLEEIKNSVPGIKENIDKVLCELYTPLSTTQKLKISIPIIPLLVSYEQETDVPRFVADRIYELKNLVLRRKGK